MQEMNSLTLNDKTYDCFVDSVARSSVVVSSASGSSIVVKDSSDRSLVGLNVYGKSTQAGTPTPAAPVDIVSVGDDGDVVVTVGGAAMTLTLANGLCGIPVTDKSLATYTDASGQMWCADEIDLERGVRVQRVAKCVSTNSAGYYALGSYARVSLNFANNYSVSTPNGLCNIAPMIGNYTLDALHFYVQNFQAWVFVPINELATQDAKGALAWLQGKGAEIYYILATPIETPLTDEETAAYKALHTNKPYTTVLNDSGAYMSMKYIADAKSYIDNKVSGIITATVE